MLCLAMEKSTLKQSWLRNTQMVDMPTTLRSIAHDDTMLISVLEQLLALTRADGVALATRDVISGDMVVELGCGIWEKRRGYRLSGLAGIEIDFFQAPYTTTCLPIVVDNTTVGSLCIGYNSRISATDMSILQAMSVIVGQALTTRQRLYHEREEIYDRALEGWVYALEMRDHETEAHTHRVTETTVELARFMGMNAEQLTHIRRGALLHDIGKIAIPDDILLKPGPLSETEWEVMRQHTQYAYDMLWPLSFLRPALDIPYYHHEKWDGSGYPQGLKGKQIPLAARIFAVVDVWDALSFARPYRPAWPKQKVLQHLRAQAGIHFDPAVVKLFLQYLDQQQSALCGIPYQPEQANRYMLA